MKKLVHDLLLPMCIVTCLVLIMSAAYVADSMKTGIYASESVPVFANEANSDKLILVIDPGHGGADGGAVSVTGKVESAINLDISLKLDEIAAFFGVETVLTRDSEEIRYPAEASSIREKKVYDQKSRVTLINSIPNAVVISVHQNNFTGYSAHGAQVFYRDGEKSEELAVELQNQLTVYTNSNSKRSAEQISDKIYLFKNISCTAAMVECGFLSNPDENALLDTDNYRTKLAVIIATGYLNCEENLTEAYFGGTNESKDSILLY